MPKYKVTAKEVREFYHFVEADSPEQANEILNGMFLDDFEHEVESVVTNGEPEEVE
jgi:hypothetical protein